MNYPLHFDGLPAMNLAPPGAYPALHEGRQQVAPLPAGGLPGASVQRMAAVGCRPAAHRAAEMGGGGGN